MPRRIEYGARGSSRQRSPNRSDYLRSATRNRTSTTIFVEGTFLRTQVLLRIPHEGARGTNMGLGLDIAMH